MDNQENQPQSSLENTPNDLTSNSSKQTSSQSNLGEFKQDSPNQISNPIDATEKTVDHQPTKPSFNSHEPIIESVNKSDSDEKNSRWGTIITIILVLIIIFGIWQSNQDKNGQTGDTNDDGVNIVVDNNQETGSVKIVDSNQSGSIDTSTPGETVKIVAFYNKNGSHECENVASLERTVEKKYDSEVINTVRGLLTALTPSEVAQGWVSSIPAGTYLKNVTILDGVAQVKFSTALKNVAGSCRVLGIRSQVEQTLKQFSYITSVNICIDNNCNQSEILQP